jgi:hypothetical protein
MMLLGSRNLAQGDTRRYRIDYAGFLAHGAVLVLAGVTVSVTGTPASKIGTGGLAPVLWPDDKSLVFYVVAGVVSETFTVNVHITDSINQIVNDTISVAVVSP